MNFLTFTSTVCLLATTCSAADNSGESFLLRSKAVIIGCGLGKNKNVLIANTDENNISLSVSPKDLKQCIVLSTSDGNLDNIFAKLFAELFDPQCILEKLSVPQTMINFKQTQSLFLECALVPEAKFAVDVAILTWLSEYVQRDKPNKSSIVSIEPALLGSFCSLIFDSSDALKFQYGILSVLTEIQELIARDLNTSRRSSLLNAVLPSLLMMIKLLDDGLVRNKAMEMASKLYQEDSKRTGPICILCLGREHAFVQSIMKDEEIPAPWNAQLNLQRTNNRKVHSLFILPSLKPTRYFMDINHSPVLTATITNATPGALVWEKFSITQVFFLSNEKFKERSKVLLLIAFQIKPPASLCTKFASCTSLITFYELLEKPLMKQMILSYGMTIFETDV